MKCEQNGLLCVRHEQSEIYAFQQLWKCVSKLPVSANKMYSSLWPDIELVWMRSAYITSSSFSDFTMLYGLLFSQYVDTFQPRVLNLLLPFRVATAEWSASLVFHKFYARCQSWCNHDSNTVGDSTAIQPPGRPCFIITDGKLAYLTVSLCLLNCHWFV